MSKLNKIYTLQIAVFAINYASITLKKKKKVAGLLSQNFWFNSPEMGPHTVGIFGKLPGDVSTSDLTTMFWEPWF